MDQAQKLYGFSERRAERRTFLEPEENSKTHSLSGLDLKFQKNLLSIKTQKKISGIELKC